MKASMSGWSQRMVPIMAPRRWPADMMVLHMESHTSMKLTGPEAPAPTLFTRAPAGLSVEKSWPMPPPFCMVRAASFTFSKMELRSSAIGPMTKQLKSVTSRPGARAGNDAARGEELEIHQRVVKALGPAGRIALRCRQGTRNPPPGGIEIGIRLAGGVAKAVFHVPDALGNLSPFHR
jgi:hypothetical protein